jgi:hypothetical protein
LVERGFWIAQFEDLVSGSHVLFLRQVGDGWIAEHWGCHDRGDTKDRIDRGEPILESARLARLKLELQAEHRSSWGMSDRPATFLEKRLARTLGTKAKREIGTVR